MRGGHRLFCSDFLLGQATFPPVQKCMGRECYQEANGDRFPRLDNHEEVRNGTNLWIEVSPLQVWEAI